MLFTDGCHLIAGELEGYVWKNRGQRVEVPIINERERRTYYGALDLMSRWIVVEAYTAGNTTNVIAYLKSLQGQLFQQRLLLLWDGESYHRAGELRKFSVQVNQGLPEEQRHIHCIQLAPNDPTQNLIEDVWLQAKNWLRRLAESRPAFSGLKALFDKFLALETFDFPKTNVYEHSRKLIRMTI